MNETGLTLDHSSMFDQRQPVAVSFEKSGVDFTHDEAQKKLLHKYKKENPVKEFPTKTRSKYLNPKVVSVGLSGIAGISMISFGHSAFGVLAMLIGVVYALSSRK